MNMMKLTTAGEDQFREGVQQQQQQQWQHWWHDNDHDDYNDDHHHHHDNDDDNDQFREGSSSSGSNGSGSNGWGWVGICHHCCHLRSWSWSCSWWQSRWLVGVHHQWCHLASLTSISTIFIDIIITVTFMMIYKVNGHVHLIHWNIQSRERRCLIFLLDDW